jgi:hypothetical protein
VTKPLQATPQEDGEDTCSSVVLLSSTSACVLRVGCCSVGDEAATPKRMTTGRRFIDDVEVPVGSGIGPRKRENPPHGVGIRSDKGKELGLWNGYKEIQKERL